MRNLRDEIAHEAARGKEKEPEKPPLRTGTAHSSGIPINQLEVEYI
ncbi:hypothetical protein J7L68_05365 [bacterium]|nr:hypothetical protein [bacterium]